MKRRLFPKGITLVVIGIATIACLTTFKSEYRDVRQFRDSFGILPIHTNRNAFIVRTTIANWEFNIGADRELKRILSYELTITPDFKPSHTDKEWRDVNLDQWKKSRMRELENYLASTSSNLTEEEKYSQAARNAARRFGFEF